MSKLININSADENDLMGLSSIGSVRAKKIIQFQPYIDEKDLIRKCKFISHRVLQKWRNVNTITFCSHVKDECICAFCGDETVIELRGIQGLSSCNTCFKEWFEENKETKFPSCIGRILKHPDNKWYIQQLLNSRYKKPFYEITNHHYWKDEVIKRGIKNIDVYVLDLEPLIGNHFVEWRICRNSNDGPLNHIPSSFWRKMNECMSIQVERSYQKREKSFNVSGKCVIFDFSPSQFHTIIIKDETFSTQRCLITSSWQPPFLMNITKSVPFTN